MVALTPECQSLWVLSPSVLLLYDQVVLDSADADWLLNPVRDTPLAARRALLLENLKGWDLVKTVDYRAIVSNEKRAWIASAAARIVDATQPRDGQNLYDSKFIQRALHAHREFSHYLENVIRFCPASDATTLRRNIGRLAVVHGRIAAMENRHVTEKLLEQVHWTLQRVVAKTLAGLIVSSKLGPDALYDTDEYRPFVRDVMEAYPELGNTYSSGERAASLRALLGALTKKSVPEVDPSDESELFGRLRDRKEFKRLRSILGQIEALYGELLGINDELVREHLSREIQRRNQEFEATLREVLNQPTSKWTWRVWEILAGATPAGAAGPLADHLRKLSDEEYEARVREGFRSGNDLSSGLFFVSELWNQTPTTPSPPTSGHLHDPGDSAFPVWGLGDRILPWYEVPDTKQER